MRRGNFRIREYIRPKEVMNERGFALFNYSFQSGKFTFIPQSSRFPGSQSNIAKELVRRSEVSEGRGGELVDDLIDKLIWELEESRGPVGSWAIVPTIALGEPASATGYLEYT